MDAPRLDCGESASIEMGDEEVLSIQPEGMVGYAYNEVGGPPENRPWRRAGINLFRSEQHARNWKQFNADF